jgi:hypothetical protein
MPKRPQYDPSFLPSGDLMRGEPSPRPSRPPPLPPPPHPYPAPDATTPLLTAGAEGSVSLPGPGQSKASASVSPPPFRPRTISYDVLPGRFALTGEHDGKDDGDMSEHYEHHHHVPERRGGRRPWVRANPRPPHPSARRPSAQGQSPMMCSPVGHRWRGAEGRDRGLDNVRDGVISNLLQFRCTLDPDTITP